MKDLSNTLSIVFCGVAVALMSLWNKVDPVAPIENAYLCFEPLTMIAISRAAGVVGGLIKTAKHLTPSDIEEAFRDSAIADMKRLTGGAGGLAQSKRQSLSAEGHGAIDRSVEEARREAMRGADVASGQAFAVEKELAKARLGATNQMLSGIREQDLEEAARQRQEAYQKAAMADQMRQQRLAGMPSFSDIVGDAAESGKLYRDLSG